MRGRTGLLGGALAALLAASGAVMVAHGASASPRLIVEQGTVDCTVEGGTVTFAPALTSPTGKGTSTVKGQVTLTHCKASTANIPSRATAGVTASIPALCAGFLSGGDTLAYTLDVTVRWGLHNIARSQVAFFPAVTTASGDFGLTFGGSGTSASGSFHGIDDGGSSMATVTSKVTLNQLATECSSARGFGKWTVTGGTVHIG